MLAQVSNNINVQSLISSVTNRDLPLCMAQISVSVQPTLVSVTTSAQTRWTHLSAAAMKDTHWLETDGRAWILMNVQLALTTASNDALMFLWEVALGVTVSQAI